MKNTFGNSLKITLFGESHGEAIGAVIDGLAPGIEIDDDYINKQLSRRRPNSMVCTARHEKDDFHIVSGVWNGRTTGTPLCIVIFNNDVKSGDYQLFGEIARPGHADYTANVKYHGFNDYRGGGHFSGRITVALVAAGAIIQCALEKKGIYIGTHIKKCADISDRDFENYIDDISALKNASLSVLDGKAGDDMIAKMFEVKSIKDSIGGILESAIVGVPAGVGEPWFDSIESMLSHALFSVPAVKGVEFGAGFKCANMLGSEMNDEFYLKGEKILTKTNNNGGINGGISNGMPIVYRCAVKPTPSIPKKQNTVNFKNKTETEIEVCGRHDTALICRACVVLEAMSAITIADLLVGRYGTDYLA